MRRMRLFSLFSLTLLAALVAGQVFLLQRGWKAWSRSIAALDLGRRQTALSERLARFGMELVGTADAERRQELRRELANVVDLTEAAHEALLRGDSFTGLPAASGELLALYLEEPWQLDKKLDLTLGAARALRSEPDAALGSANPHLARLLASTPPLVEAQTEIVRRHSELVQAEIDRMYRRIMLVAGVELLALLSAALVLVRSARHPRDERAVGLEVA